LSNYDSRSGSVSNDEKLERQRDGTDARNQKLISD
jgi:hypothetical protein